MNNVRLERVDRNLPAVTQVYTAGNYVQEPEPAEESLPVSHYLWILRRHRWKILSFVMVSVIATFVVTKRLTPIYESTATVDIDRQTPTAALGQDSVRTPTFDSDQFLATQIRLVESDSVIRPVVQRLRLKDTEKEYAKELKESSQGADSEDAPKTLKRLAVVRPHDTYLLLISYRSADPRLAAEVANGIANSYLDHTYKIRFDSSAGLSRFMERQLEELKAKMERSAASLAQFQKEFSVIDPQQKTSILSSRLLQLNTEYTNAQGDRVRKETGFNSMKSGSIEAALISTQGESLKRLTEQSNEAQQRFEEVKLHYAANHPEYKKAAAQVEELRRQLNETKNSIGQRIEIEYRQAAQREEMLKAAVAQTKAEFDTLNAHSFDYESLKQEAEADRKLYDELVRKIKEAGINASFQSSSVRIADLARPAIKPVFPSIRLNLLLAFLCSTLLGVMAAIVSDVMDTTIRDPEQVRRTLQTDVVGTLPAMKSWRGRLAPLIGKQTSAELVPLSDLGDKGSNGYDEAIRTLRNSILLTDFDRRLRSILVTSASPSEGKSTVAAHLAAAHAEQKQKTLIIDGDLRRPSLHKFFDFDSKKGLSNVLTEGMSWRDVVLQPEQFGDLHVIQAGPPSRRAADLIGRSLPQILEEASLEYDLVVLDAPPLLGFPEPLQMASAVDGVVIVARAEFTNRKAVASVIATLGRLRANVIGLVLNEVRKEMSESYSYYGYYDKYYRPDNGKGA
ncbi:MAG: transport protein [Bryobacterales bacterium]|nr:transport protein [Bryobacterales bacterium]